MIASILALSLSTFLTAAPDRKEGKKSDVFPAVVDDNSGLTFTVDPSKASAVNASDKNGKAVWKFDFSADPKIMAGARVVVMQIVPNKPDLLRVVFDRGGTKTEMEFDTKSGKMVSKKDGK